MTTVTRRSSAWSSGIPNPNPDPSLREACDAHGKLMAEAEAAMVKKEAPTTGLMFKTTVNVEPPQPSSLRDLRWEDISPDALLDIVAEGIVTGPLAERVAKLEAQVEVLTVLLRARK